MPSWDFLVLWAVIGVFWLVMRVLFLWRGERRLRSLFFWLLSVVVTFSVACTSEHRDKQSDVLSTSIDVREDLRGEIASTVEGFYEAYLNGELGKLLTYLSRTCTASDIEKMSTDSLLFSAFGGGKIDMEIDKSGLNIRRDDDNHVTVLPGVDGGSPVTIKIDGRPLLLDDAEGVDDANQIDKIDLVREDGVWRVANCDDFARVVEEFDAK